MHDSTQKHPSRFRWRGVVGIPFLGPGETQTLLLTSAIFDGTWLALAADFLPWVAVYRGLTLRLWPTLYAGGCKLRVLVTDGPYSICRKPLCLGSFLIMISCGWWLQGPTFSAAFGLAILVFMGATLRAEEERPREQHGAPYDEYCRNVPRCWSRFRTSESVEVKVSGLRSELKREQIWMRLSVTGELVAHFRAEACWPHMLHLP